MRRQKCVLYSNQACNGQRDSFLSITTTTTNAMSYSLAIFDFDGTLANSFAAFIRALNEAANKYTFRKIDEHGVELLRKQDALKALKHLGIAEHKLPFISRYVRSRMMRDMDQISLFEGTDHLLEQLNIRGVIVAIVSASRSADVRRILGPKNEGLIQHFACGAAFLNKRTKLRQLLRRSKIEPFQSILVGDQITDLLAAREVNISFGAVSWGFNSGESLRRHSPDFQFESMDEILENVPWTTHSTSRAV